MAQMFKIDVESHLINPGNAERSLFIITSLFFGHIKDTKYLHVAKQLLYKARNVI